jgi:hypothetical protein
MDVEASCLSKGFETVRNVARDEVSQSIGINTAFVERVERWRCHSTNDADSLRTSGKRCHGGTYPSGLGNGVVIREEDNAAGNGVDARIARRCRPRSAAAYDSHSFYPLYGRIDWLDRIVHNDDVKSPFSLLTQDGIQAAT